VNLWHLSYRIFLPFIITKAALKDIVSFNHFSLDVDLVNGFVK